MCRICTGVDMTKSGKKYENRLEVVEKVLSLFISTNFILDICSLVKKSTICIVCFVFCLVFKITLDAIAFPKGLSPLLSGSSCQVSNWFFTTFSVPGLKEKLHHIENLQQLFTCILPEQIDIPPFVLEYDAQVCWMISHWVVVSLSHVFVCFLCNKCYMCSIFHFGKWKKCDLMHHDRPGRVALYGQVYCG